MMANRIVIANPFHPLLLLFYSIFLFPIFITTPAVFSSLSSFLGLSTSASVLLGFFIPLLSISTSFINIVIKRYKLEGFYYAIESRYVNYFGIPIPVYVPVLQQKEIVLAINVGGALIPISFSILLLTKLYFLSPTYFTYSLSVILVTAVVTYYFSRAIPGAGIAVPSLIPPLTSAILTTLFIGSHYIFPIAYSGGVLGSLIGADVLRLIKDFEKFKKQYGPVFLSIGGAGTFDGVFLSGLFAVMLSLLIG